MSDVDFEKHARASGLRTIRKVAPYLWPEGRPRLKVQVVLALAALVVSKLIAVATPFFYKAAVDTLSGDEVSKRD